MGAKDSQESELDVGRTGSGLGEAALPFGAKRDNHQGSSACHLGQTHLCDKINFYDVEHLTHLY